MSSEREFGVRVLLAVGDRELERRLARELPEAGITISGRALDGPTLLERAREPGSDVVLAAADLHRLTEGLLTSLREQRLPVVLLVAGAEDGERLAALGRVVPASSTTAVIAAAVMQARSHGVAYAAHDVAGGGAAGAVPGAARGSVIAVASGKGAPGKTTIAIALAASLAAAGLEVALVDADLRGGNVAPYLDLDPRRGLVGLAAVGGPISDRIADELQDGPGFAVLAGVERPELAVGLRDEVLSGAVAALRERFERVIIDLGTPASPALLRLADELLLVCGADLVSIWNARIGLRAILETAGGAALSVVVNRREGREHYAAAEIERALGVPVVGVVREDRRVARRAIAKQIPLSEAGGGAARDLRALAEQLERVGRDEHATRAAAQPALAGER